LARPNSDAAEEAYADGLKIQEGVAKVFDKIHGGQDFQKILPWGVPLIWVLLHFCYQVFIKFVRGIAVSPPLCASRCGTEKKH
jgi:hypothetical protein